MICIAGKLPVLQVGRHQVCGYQTDWIRVGLEKAASRAGREAFPFLDDIYDSIVHYLEHKCSLRLMPVEKLNERIYYMLKRIGCEHIARALPPMAPPIAPPVWSRANCIGEMTSTSCAHHHQQQGAKRGTHQRVGDLRDAPQSAVGRLQIVRVNEGLR